MNTLIVGGTSGLGLEIARNEVVLGARPIIVGRDNPDVDFAEYREFDLKTGDLSRRIGQFVMDLPPVTSLVYAAGFYQEGHITDLNDDEVDAMMDVGARGLIFFVKKILEKQDKLDELVTVTSTSQWVPREFEQVYNFVKAGAKHYSHAQSLDPRVRRVLVVAPSGMSTEFWENTGKDTSKMMPPEWVAERVMELRQRDDGYVFAKILGATGELPKRVEIVEPRSSQIAEEAATVGAVLRWKRIEAGYSQKAIAQSAGISRYLLSQIESGKPQRPTSTKPWRPTRRVLTRLATALRLDPLDVQEIAGY